MSTQEEIQGKHYRILEPGRTRKTFTNVFLKNKHNLLEAVASKEFEKK